MGQKHSLQDDLITFRLTSKQLIRSSKKCESNMAEQKAKLKKAIEKGNMEGARIYAQNLTREKNQSLNMLKMASRIDAVASRLESAMRMQDISKAMSQTVSSMSNAMKSMNVEHISKTMEEFEKQFEDMDVRSGYMENAMDNATSMTTPPEEVDRLIQMVADEAGLTIQGELDSVGTYDKNSTSQVSEEVKPNDDFEARLAALRR